MFKGSNVALITPFKNDKLDVDSYIKLIHFHMENGTNGLVPAGTTGESPTLSHDEHQKVIDLCIQESKGKLPVIAGTGSNSTEEAISLTNFGFCRGFKIFIKTFSLSSWSVNLGFFNGIRFFSSESTTL